MRAMSAQALPPGEHPPDDEWRTPTWTESITWAFIFTMAVFWASLYAITIFATLAWTGWSLPMAAYLTVFFPAAFLRCLFGALNAYDKMKEQKDESKATSRRH